MMDDQHNALANEIGCIILKHTPPGTPITPWLFDAAKEIAIMVSGEKVMTDAQRGELEVPR